MTQFTGVLIHVRHFFQICDAIFVAILKSHSVVGNSFIVFFFGYDVSHTMVSVVL